MPGFGFQGGNSLVMIDEIFHQKFQLVIYAGKALIGSVEFGVHIVFQDFIESAQQSQQRTNQGQKQLIVGHGVLLWQMDFVQHRTAAI